MASQLELYINGTGINDTAVGKIDLYGDEPISLSISIQDVKDISKRNSTFSQTFTIPANKNNNILLNHIFNIGSDSEFDPRKKTPCFMLVDTTSVFNGNFQLTKINVKNKNVISYDCVVYGEVIDLVKILGESLLTDLDFSELDHKYTISNIVESWSSETRYLGYYYPLIDYGYDLNLAELNNGVLSVILYTGTATGSSVNTLTDSVQTWNVGALTGYQVSIVSGVGAGQTRNIITNTLTSLTVTVNWDILPDTSSVFHITKLDYSNPYSSSGNGLSPLIFKPALSNYYLIKKILTNAGFSVTPGFLDTETFAETIIPFTGDIGDTLTDEYIQSISFRAGLSADWNQDLPPQFDDITAPNFDNGNLYDTVYPQGYVADRVSSQDFVVNITYQYNNVAPYPDLCTVRFYRSTYTSGPFSTVNFTLGVMDTNVHTLQAISAKCDNINSTTGLKPIQTGEKITCVVSFTSGAVFPGPVLHFAKILKTGSYWYNRVSPQLAAGGDVLFNKFIPKKIKQVDYIKSIITLFNLMVIPDKDNPKRLTFIPRDEYYALGVIKDWSEKIDHSNKIEETLLSEQQEKRLFISYKADKDFYNTNYTDSTNTIYGQYTYNFDNEWIEGEKKIEVIFSPTPVDKVPGSGSGPSGKGIFLPKIAKRDVKTGIYDRTEANIRFLRKNPTLMDTTDTIQLTGLSGQNSYPYCGHLDDPINANTDYNFGPILYSYYEELTSLTPNNLVYVYWKKYIDEIADKNSKLIKCKIYLTPNDIAQFNYNDSIFIEGLTDDGGHYFIVNKIIYSPSSNLPSDIELIKVADIKVPYSVRHSIGPIRRTVGPFNALVLGDSKSESGNTVINGVSNLVGYNSPGAFIVGNNNTIAPNTPGVVLINTYGQNISDPFVTIVGNTYFYPDGTTSPIYTDINSGEDVVFPLFSTNAYNDIDSAQDAVLGIGSTSPVQDINSGEDVIV